MKLLQHLSHFISERWDKESPLIVAVSGGNDSLALLHALHQLQIPCEVAHVDHGWRSSSREEAMWVKKQVRALGIPFHLGELSSLKKGNKEAQARAGRIDFLTRCCEQRGGQAILLGHHRKDQAETVLKSVFQGNALPYSKGMAEESYWKGIAVWRPFLKVSKEQIQQFLDELKLNPLQDPSNQDSHYLRVRMRQKIMPELSSFFGKEIESPLVRLGNEMQLLEEHLEKRIVSLKQSLVVGQFGSYLPSVLEADHFELRYFLRKISPVPLPVAIVEKVVTCLFAGVADKKLEAGGVEIQIDRGRLFLISKPFPKVDKWVLKPTEMKKMDCDPLASLWRGEMIVTLPKKYDSLAQGVSCTPYVGSKSLGRWWGEKKVPSFLRSVVPVALNEGKVVQEFLTGRRHPHLNQCDSVFLKLSCLI